MFNGRNEIAERFTRTGSCLDQKMFLVMQGGRHCVRHGTLPFARRSSKCADRNI
jgi:hypothetical protein